MNRIQQYGLLLTCLFACACGNAGKAIQQSPNKPASIAQTGLTQRTTKDLIKMVKTPTSPAELLQNLQFALTQELLLREDFYTEENLKRFTGASTVEFFPKKVSTGEFMRIDISDFNQIPRYKPYDPKSPDFITLAFIGRKKEDGKLMISATVDFEFGDPRVNYTELEKLFGSKWSIQTPEPYCPLRNYQEPTAEHGNEEWGYTLMHPNNVEELMSITFAPDALTSSIYFRLEQK